MFLWQDEEGVLESPYSASSYYYILVPRNGILASASVHRSSCESTYSSERVDDTAPLPYG